MNSVFSAFKSNKKSLAMLNGNESEPNKISNGKIKRTHPKLNDNNYEKLRHLRGKMSNLVLDNDELNFRKPTMILPIASYDSVHSLSNNCDCTNSSLSANIQSQCDLPSSLSSSSLSIVSMQAPEKLNISDYPENYSSENNLCFNGDATKKSNKLIKKSIEDNSSLSASNFFNSSLEEANILNSNNFNKQPMSNDGNSSINNVNRNKPRLSLSNINSSFLHPEVHGKNKVKNLIFL